MNTGEIPTGNRQPARAYIALFGVQLTRFEERQQTSYKRFKITPEDWRNRDKWDAYQAAACDMIDRTSTDHAPWTLIEANDKNHARIKILKTLCERIEAAF